MAASAGGANVRLSHACLIGAASEGEALDRAWSMACAAVCSGDRPPCGDCRDCRKARAHIHPDISVIGLLEDDKGRLKKEIGVDQIRRLSADAALLPNEAGRKVYIISPADAMNASAQNAALKLLEEPPENVVFLLCAVNTELLLPTVRSRCTAVNLGGAAGGAEAETEGLAEAYLKAVAAGDRAKLYAWCAANDGMDTRAAADFIDCADGLIADGLCSRGRSRGFSPVGLMGLHALMERCGTYLRANTGVKHIFGLLAVDSMAAAETEGL